MMVQFFLYLEFETQRFMLSTTQERPNFMKYFTDSFGVVPYVRKMKEYTHLLEIYDF